MMGCGRWKKCDCWPSLAMNLTRAAGDWLSVGEASRSDPGVGRSGADIVRATPWQRYRVHGRLGQFCEVPMDASTDWS